MSTQPIVTTRTEITFEIGALPTVKEVLNNRDLLKLILEKLPANDIARSTTVCRAFYETISEKLSQRISHQGLFEKLYKVARSLPDNPRFYGSLLIASQQIETDPEGALEILDYEDEIINYARSAKDKIFLLSSLATVVAQVDPDLGLGIFCELLENHNSVSDLMAESFFIHSLCISLANLDFQKVNVELLREIERKTREVLYFGGLKEFASELKQQLISKNIDIRINYSVMLVINNDRKIDTFSDATKLIKVDFERTLDGLVELDNDEMKVVALLGIAAEIVGTSERLIECSALSKTKIN